MTFDPLRRGRTNRDRRDQAFARSVIAEATRRHNAESYTWRIGDVFTDGTHRWKVDSVHGDKAVLRSCGSSWATTTALTFSEWREGGRWRLEAQNTYATDLDVEAYTSNPPKDVPTPAALEAAEQVLDENVEWVEPDCCPYCNDPLSGNCGVRDDNYPYCSKRCAISAEIDSDD